MKPDSYMPFLGNDFFMAVEGQSPVMVVAYLRIIWFYWHHNHCKGLKDDDEYLRGLSRIDREDWPTYRDIIFDNSEFMTQDHNGFWHQKFAEAKWNEVTESYNLAVARGKSGAKERWKGHKKK